MYFPKFELRTHSNQNHSMRAEVLGHIFSIASASKYKNIVTLSDFSQCVLGAFEHGHYHIAYNRRGLAVAYVIWAIIELETENRIVQTGSWHLHPSEWNEAGRFWIVDICCPYFPLLHYLRSLKTTVFMNVPTVCYLHTKNGRWEARACSIAPAAV
jgi:hemolysin-activating ACP:hemolysin acyltransferase